MAALLHWYASFYNTTLVYANLSYILMFENPNLQAQWHAHHTLLYMEHPEKYLQTHNCTNSNTLAWDLLAFHTSQPYSKLGHNTVRRMRLRVLKSKAKLRKPRYKPSCFCLLGIINDLFLLPYFGKCLLFRYFRGAGQPRKSNARMFLHSIHTLRAFNYRGLPRTTKIF